MAGRNESVGEFKAMVTCLHKEMGMMQLQLDKYKEAAHEVHSLRAKVHSLADICDRKVSPVQMSLLGQILTSLG